MLAAIEIYNKPQIAYRDECFSILLINAWELLVKAILSKNRQRIYYPKHRGQAYRTFSLPDALRRAQACFPPNVAFEPVVENVHAIAEYRDNSIHFYNQTEFRVVLYGLAQTSVVNYRDLMCGLFGVDIAEEMTISLLPLGFGVSPDPIEFLRDASAVPPRNKMVAQYLQKISTTARMLEEQKCDTARFLAVFTVSLQSVKKISAADIVVGVDGDIRDPEAKVVQRRVDPNQTHPYRRKDVLEVIGPVLQGVRFTSHSFEAIAHKYGLKGDRQYHWRPKQGGSGQYSPDMISRLRGLSADEIRFAVREYNTWLADRRKTDSRDKTMPAS